MHVLQVVTQKVSNTGRPGKARVEIFLSSMIARSTEGTLTSSPLYTLVATSEKGNNEQRIKSKFDFLTNRNISLF